MAQVDLYSLIQAIEYAALIMGLVWFFVAINKRGPPPSLTHPPHQ